MRYFYTRANAYNILDIKTIFKEKNNFKKFLKNLQKTLYNFSEMKYNTNITSTD